MSLLGAVSAVAVRKGGGAGAARWAERGSLTGRAERGRVVQPRRAGRRSPWKRRPRPCPCPPGWRRERGRSCRVPPPRAAPGRARGGGRAGPGGRSRGRRRAGRRPGWFRRPAAARPGSHPAPVPPAVRSRTPAAPPGSEAEPGSPQPARAGLVRRPRSRRRGPYVLPWPRGPRRPRRASARMIFTARCARRCSKRP